MAHGYAVDLAAGGCADMDLIFSGEVIPAQTVQKAFLAALEGDFAKIV